jgi:hypothetical protein
VVLLLVVVLLLLLADCAEHACRLAQHLTAAAIQQTYFNVCVAVSPPFDRVDQTAACHLQATHTMPGSKAASARRKGMPADSQLQQAVTAQST